MRVALDQVQALAVPRKQGLHLRSALRGVTPAVLPTRLVDADDHGIGLGELAPAVEGSSRVGADLEHRLRPVLFDQPQKLGELWHLLPGGELPGAPAEWMGS